MSLCEKSEVFCFIRELRVHYNPITTASTLYNPRQNSKNEMDLPSLIYFQVSKRYDTSGIHTCRQSLVARSFVFDFWVVPICFAGYVKIELKCNLCVIEQLLIACKKILINELSNLIDIELEELISLITLPAVEWNHEVFIKLNNVGERVFILTAGLIGVIVIGILHVCI